MILCFFTGCVHYPTDELDLEEEIDNDEEVDLDEEEFDEEDINEWGGSVFCGCSSTAIEAHNFLFTGGSVETEIQ